MELERRQNRTTRLCEDGDYLMFESGISGEILLMKSKPKWGLLIIAGVGMVVAILVVKKKRGWQTAKAIQ